ncbi:hypothetical protein ACFYNL_13730 [Streptomyces sp. NPDC007808]|uniref:hypothetical protein n=1 Tax=Streptomyces sp. NPDC007808 TaxID=3364779 RepID=UPI00368A6CED
MGTGVPSTKAFVFVIGILFSVVVGLGAVILKIDRPLTPEIPVCGAAFATSMFLWIAAMALWSTS